MPMRHVPFLFPRSFLRRVALLMALALVSLAVPLKTASAKQHVRLTDIVLQACNALEFGFVTIKGKEDSLGHKPLGCGLVRFRKKHIEVPQGEADGTQLWLRDNTCGTIYFSDGSGNANHARITDLGGGQFLIDIADGGGNCENAN